MHCTALHAASIEYYLAREVLEESDVLRWCGGRATEAGAGGDVHAALGHFVGSILEARPRRRIVAYDLTLAAPKAVSVLAALGPEEVAEQVRRAHGEAVDRALDYLLEGAMGAQRRAGATRTWVPGSVAVLAAAHVASRAGDPHLHAHLVVLNDVATPDGRSSALDRGRLQRSFPAASALYHCQLRFSLVHEVGLRLGRWQGDTAVPEVVAPALVAAFSRRREEVIELTATWGSSSARARRQAALQTRGPKPPARSFADWRVAWAERAEFLLRAEPDLFGPALDWIGRLGGSDGLLTERRDSRAAPPGRSVIEMVAGPVLSRVASAVSGGWCRRDDLVVAVCRAARSGLPAPAVTRVVARLQTSGLLPSAIGTGGGRWWVSPEAVAIEDRLARRAARVSEPARIGRRRPPSGVVAARPDQSGFRILSGVRPERADPLVEWLRRAGFEESAGQVLVGDPSRAALWSALTGYEVVPVGRLEPGPGRPTVVLDADRLPLDELERAILVAGRHPVVLTAGSLHGADPARRRLEALGRAAGGVTPLVDDRGDGVAAAARREMEPSDVWLSSGPPPGLPPQSGSSLVVVQGGLSCAVSGSLAGAAAAAAREWFHAAERDPAHPPVVVVPTPALFPLAADALRAEARRVAAIGRGVDGVGPIPRPLGHCLFAVGDRVRAFRGPSPRLRRALGLEVLDVGVNGLTLGEAGREEVFLSPGAAGRLGLHLVALATPGEARFRAAPVLLLAPTPSEVLLRLAGSERRSHRPAVFAVARGELGARLRAGEARAVADTTEPAAVLAEAPAVRWTAEAWQIRRVAPHQRHAGEGRPGLARAPGAPRWAAEAAEWLFGDGAALRAPSPPGVLVRRAERSPILPIGEVPGRGREAGRSRADGRAW